MALRSPLGRVRGLGSAKEGVSHWWAQRLTAIALVPLSFWFVISVIGLIGADYAEFDAWISTPGNAAMAVLFVAAIFHHAQLGLQVVIEDYVHHEGAKFASLITVKLLSLGLAAFTIVAVFQTAVGG